MIHQKQQEEDLFELRSLQDMNHYVDWMVHRVQPFLGTRILEVGAGLGTMTKGIISIHRKVKSYTALEPEDFLYRQIKNDVDIQNLSSKNNINLEILPWGTYDLDFKKLVNSPENQVFFDTVVSFNVLEHIKNPEEALQDQLNLLRNSKPKQPDGIYRCICLVPAHSWAYGSFDQKFGHYRRYKKKWFQDFIQQQAPDFEIKCKYMNLWSLPGWVILGRLFKKQHFNSTALKTFNRLLPKLAPIDDWIHDVLGLPLGQSIIAIMTLKP